MTVGVAGLIQSGGFGSFSKAYGTGARRACSKPRSSPPTARCGSPTPARDPDLFWALKGGGGGSLGVVTRLTLRTHDLPEYFGARVRDDPGEHRTPRSAG